MESPYDKIKAAWAESAYEDISIGIAQGIHKLCESPIEKILAEALAVLHATYLEGYGAYPHLIGLAATVDEPWLFNINPQVQIGKYRVDFMVECAACPERKLAVECDGHEYHERTKEQAKHDKSRDRFFITSGLSVMRFTGSEIYKDPVACALEVARFFEQFVSWDKLQDKAEELVAYR